MFSQSLSGSHIARLAIIALGAVMAACGVSTRDHNALLDDYRASQEALESCQANNSDLFRENASLGQGVNDCQSEIALLRAHDARASTEASRRQEIYAQLMGRLEGMIESGHLQIRVEDGRIVLVLPQDVLFESGDSQLGDEGGMTLADVGAALRTLTDQHFQVEGHTDNVPISNGLFASNWDLSTGRAVSVVNLLIEQGVSPANLSAAGFGEFTPDSTNESPEGRAQNRRIEIVLVPDLGDIPEAEANAM
jgi:chemotaxis protein MotB